MSWKKIYLPVDVEFYGESIFRSPEMIWEVFRKEVEKNPFWPDALVGTVWVLWVVSLDQLF